jgi:hypothetical protein
MWNILSGKENQRSSQQPKQQHQAGVAEIGVSNSAARTPADHHHTDKRVQMVIVVTIHHQSYCCTSFSWAALQQVSYINSHVLVKSKDSRVSLPLVPDSRRRFERLRAMHECCGAPSICLLICLQSRSVSGAVLTPPQASAGLLTRCFIILGHFVCRAGARSGRWGVLVLIMLLLGARSILHVQDHLVPLTVRPRHCPARRQLTAWTIHHDHHLALLAVEPQQPVEPWPVPCRSREGAERAMIENHGDHDKRQA